MKVNKIVVVLATGVIFLILGFILMFTNSDKKEDTKKENNDSKLNACEKSLKDNKKKPIMIETDGKKIEIPVLDCVEEKEKTEEEITYASKDNKYQVKVKEWQSDIETLSNIMIYNYSIQENYPAHLLLSESITTENGINYKLVQAHQAGENDEITLKNHIILYTINENITLSIEFSYTIDELPAEHFSEIVDNIKNN